MSNKVLRFTNEPIAITTNELGYNTPGQVITGTIVDFDPSNMSISFLETGKNLPTFMFLNMIDKMEPLSESVQLNFKKVDDGHFYIESSTGAKYEAKKVAYGNTMFRVWERVPMSFSWATSKLKRGKVIINEAMSMMEVRETIISIESQKQLAANQ